MLSALVYRVLTGRSDLPGADLVGPAISAAETNPRSRRCPPDPEWPCRPALLVEILGPGVLEEPGAPPEAALTHMSYPQNTAVTTVDRYALSPGPAGESEPPLGPPPEPPAHRVRAARAAWISRREEALGYHAAMRDAGWTEDEIQRVQALVDLDSRMPAGWVGSFGIFSRTLPAPPVVPPPASAPWFASLRVADPSAPAPSVRNMTPTKYRDALRAASAVAEAMPGSSFYEILAEVEAGPPAPLASCGNLVLAWARGLLRYLPGRAEVALAMSEARRGGPGDENDYEDFGRAAREAAEQAEAERDGDPRRYRGRGQRVELDVVEREGVRARARYFGYPEAVAAAAEKIAPRILATRGWTRRDDPSAPGVRVHCYDWMALAAEALGIPVEETKRGEWLVWDPKRDEEKPPPTMYRAVRGAILRILNAVLCEPHEKNVKSLSYRAMGDLWDVEEVVGVLSRAACPIVGADRDGWTLYRAVVERREVSSRGRCYGIRRLAHVFERVGEEGVVERLACPVRYERDVDPRCCPLGPVEKLAVERYWMSDAAGERWEAKVEQMARC